MTLTLQWMDKIRERLAEVNTSLEKQDDEWSKEHARAVVIFIDPIMKYGEAEEKRIIDALATTTNEEQTEFDEPGTEEFGGRR